MLAAKERLDQLLENLVDLESQICQLKEQGAQLMNDGQFQFAHACQDDPNLDLTRRNYENKQRMCASLKVNASKQSDHIGYQLCNIDISASKNGTAEDEADTEEKEDTGIEREDSLRKRNTRFHGPLDQDSFVKPDETTSASNTVLEPIHWFGYIVPPGVRNGRAKFRRSLDIWIQVAVLQQKCQHLEKSISALVTDKNNSNT